MRPITVLCCCGTIATVPCSRSSFLLLFAFSYSEDFVFAALEATGHEHVSDGSSDWSASTWPC